MKTNKEQVVINLNSRTLVLEIGDFASSPVDLDQLLQIDMNNILADIITWPVVFNEIANIKAQIDALLREAQLDFKIYEAQRYEELKKEFVRKGEKATETAIDMAIKRSPEYKVKSFNVINVEKQANIVDGMYWAAKSKDKKLETISAKIKPEDFENEILLDTINNVYIKSYKNNFQQKRK